MGWTEAEHQEIASILAAMREVPMVLASVEFRVIHRLGTRQVEYAAYIKAKR